ncbi:MAG: DEAD/DEAH box helicase family protein [Clostridia bacterium]|nr:DEAD/DEAH box helicase family protein [Clostridia bacterium]
MKTFNGVRFAWTFRTYQQAVLDKASAHLRDGHIHIVAAPGSGKTILGLELVRRLGKPTLILAPSVTIRRQWGERFAECFLPKGAKEEEYVSEDLHTPQLLTCVTYQALHAAMQKAVLKTQDDPEAAENSEAQDFTDFDLMKTVRDCGVAVVCLDEAHHLRREWQKALEEFLTRLGKSVQVIALTATPPYDSTPAEWDNYIRVCGEVDEEIFVPQLVAQKTLCPHQDYVYFNMPTEAETQVLEAHRQHAVTAAKEVLGSGLLKNAWSVCQNAQKTLPDSSALSLAASQDDVSLTTMQAAVSCILDNKDVFPPEIVDPLTEILARNAVLEKGKVCLRSTDKIDKMLLASAGKLDSIRAVISSEATVLGEELRALILTDYIRKEMLGLIGTEEPLTMMGAVPVFEAVRRTVGRHVPIALLSGTLVILPNEALDDAKRCAGEMQIVCTASPLPNVLYSTVQFAGSNKNKVSVVTKLFQQGVLRVLIGTASLLGEGWDAPCINALILASYVGSFMLTNQMRGRAIRIDKAKPDKASNIWHLVTMEPKSDESDDPGADYAVMERRFATFLAPSYTEPWIESGTDRLSLPQTPFDVQTLREVNAQMLERSQDRNGMAALWQQSIADDPAPQVLDVCEIPQKAYVGTPAKKALLRGVLCADVFALLLLLPGFLKALAAVPAIPALVFFGKWNRMRKPEKFFESVGEALLAALRRQKTVQGSGKIFVRSMPQRSSLYAALENAGQHDKMVFSRAMGTLFSAIDDPRYIFLPEDRDCKSAHAVPEPFEKKKEDAQAFTEEMKPFFGKTVCLYTRSDKERKTFSRCRTDCALNREGSRAQYKKIVVISK